jgi:dienelactone hydrolase
MRIAVISILVILFSFDLHAQIKTRIIEYQQGETQLQGTLYYDPILKSIRGGILILHDENGAGEFIAENAQMLAGIGYIVFVADLFGKDSKEPKKIAQQLAEDRTLLLARAMAGLDQLKEQPTIDATRLATIGYAIGGTAALELARSGADIRATACFYGDLTTIDPSQAHNIRGIILVFLGAKDGRITTDALAAFKEEMDGADVDWQINLFGNATHGFANPQSGDDTASGTAYNYNADKRSWETVKAIYFMLLK